MNPPTSPARPASTGASFVDATNAGFSNIGEYLKNGPKLIAEQKRADQAMEQFYKKIDRLDAEYAQMQRQYQQEAASMKKALTRLASAPVEDKTPPAGSREPVRAPVARAEAPPDSPYLPNFFTPPAVAQNGGSDSNYVAEPMVAPIAKSDAGAIPEGMTAFDGGLESARRPQGEDLAQKSTIAVQSKELDKEGKNPLGGLVLGSKGKGISKSGTSLRDSLKAALARKPASGESTGKGADSNESGSQQATRSALEEMKALSSSGESSASVNAGGGIKNEGFKMDGSETSAEVARLKGELNDEKQSAPEVLGKESADLFDRVRGAHVRSQKNGRVSLLQKN